MMEASATRPIEGLTIPPSEIKVASPLASQRSKPWNRWLREPLLHFLLIGFALFAGYALFSPPSAPPVSTRIELTTDDLNQLQLTWMAQWQRPPTPDELRGLIDTKVRQEILFREGLALGLDQGDEIVKRRMAQKMEFLAEDTTTVRDPSTAELKSWFEKNAARFALPGQVTFHHLYFSPDKRGQQAKDDAARTLARLTGRRADETSMRAGDSFMFQSYYADSSPDQLGNVFGTEFAVALFKQKPGSWQGPISSGLGWHLVFIDSLTPGRVPTFAEADQSAVKTEWLADQREESKRKAFEAMRARYQVVLPEGAIAPVAGPTRAQPLPAEALANP